MTIIPVIIYQLYRIIMVTIVICVLIGMLW
jgi:hypothetical protein